MIAEGIPEIGAVISRIRLGNGREFAGALPIEIAFLDDDAADRGAVSPDDFGQRLDDDVGAVFKRIEDRRC